MVLSERIKSLVAHSGLSIPKFATSVGVKTPQAVRELLSGRTKTLSYEMECKILTAYPEVNPVWLKTGEGEMLKSVADDIISQKGGNRNIGKVGGNVDQREGIFYEPCADDAQRIRELEKEVENLRAQLSHKDDMIAELRNSAAKQDARIANLERINEFLMSREQ